MQTLPLVLVVLVSTILLALFIWLLSIYRRLFTGIRNTWLRRNVTVLLLAILGMASCLILLSPQLILADNKNKDIFGLLLKELGQISIIVLFVFNVVWFIGNSRRIKNLSFKKHHAVIIPTIVVSTLLIYTIIKYVDNGMKYPANFHYALIVIYFNALMGAFIYTAVNYVEQQRRRKLDEKELEVTRLMALKTKAELEALHSKINPHFLYNALNSIADLSVTDGKKARKMTIALADLFRFSINYSNNNYSTVKEEVEMAEVYLQIEKIRFEDQLNYTVNVDKDAEHYLVPRFILQPIVENAVKHGLKATGKMTEIVLEVKKTEEGLLLNITDNGPDFPEQLNPGYGIKSIFDKLDLLFATAYDLRFNNGPRKEVSIYLNKLMKHEPAIQDHRN